MDGKQIFKLTFLHFWSDVGNSRLFRTTSYEQSREYTEQELDHILTSCLTQYFINSEEFPLFVERTVIWRNISHITEQSRNYHATFSSSQIACKRTEYAAVNVSRISQKLVLTQPHTVENRGISMAPLVLRLISWKTHPQSI